MDPSRSYDDNESLPDPEDGWRIRHRIALKAIEDVQDEATRKALFIILLISLGLKVGRDG